jgi:hypothetical protein
MALSLIPGSLFRGRALRLQTVEEKKRAAAGGWPGLLRLCGLARYGGLATACGRPRHALHILAEYMTSTACQAWVFGWRWWFYRR